MDSLIRHVNQTDAGAIADIYAPFVESSHVTFETTPPDATEMAGRIERTTERYPWLVCELDEDILGYAYASSFHERTAYQWTATVSVYVSPPAQRQGIAQQLYAALFSVLERQGVRSAIAIIALPNPESVAFHEQMGFERVASFENVGYKHGTWHDVGHWQRTIRTQTDDPEPFVPVSELESLSD
ncbi:GNAT family N-acetyltransferase [Halocatena halophila]|uniref:GNAT family N-acetyltransferase n=1 Tax=Halocatena halophila TaxID=2814576 RepID=UPI002ED3527B